MKASLLIGRFWGAEVRLHISLLLIIPYVLIAFRPGSVNEALRLLLLMVALFACVALHEMGHTAAARMFGIHVNSIVLWPLGGMANLSRQPERTLQRVVISAAGPLTNLVIFGLLLPVAGALWVLQSAAIDNGLTRLLWSINAFPFLAGLLIANLTLAVFNLAPVYPLDGGQIARGLLSHAFGERAADRILLLISLPLILLLTGYGLVIGDPLVILTGLLLVYAVSSLNIRLYTWITQGILYLTDRGGYYLRRLDFDPAAQAYSRAITAKPKQTGLYINRAITYMNLMECGRAKTDLEQALALDPNQPTGLMLLGELHVMAKEYDAAQALFERVTAASPNTALVYADRGALLMELGKVEEARADFDRAVSLSHGSVLVHLMRSQFRYQTGDRAGSEADAERALRYAPQAMLVFPEIFLPFFQGALEWSLEYYERAIRQMPDAYQGFAGRADALRMNGSDAWAAADYTRAIALAPKQPELYLNRGRVLRRMGMEEQARTDFAQAAGLAAFAHIRRQARAMLDGKPYPGDCVTAATGEGSPIN